MAKIHADWCGVCLKLNETFETLRKETGDRALIVVLDVTDRESAERSRAEANRLGIRDFFEDNKTLTGTVGVFDRSGNPVKIFRAELDPDEYLKALGQEPTPAPSVISP